MPRIIVSVTSDLVTDQRVHRVCLSLHNEGYEVLLIGRKLPCSLEPGVRLYKYKRLHLLFKKGPLFYAWFNIRLFIKLLFSRADVFLANDLDTLPANFFAARIRNKKLIYDSHELFTEVPELVRRPKIQRIWGKWEKLILPKIDAGYTVSAPIADYYNELYGCNLQVIRNLPHKKHSEIPINQREDILIYQGALNEGRGLELLIEAMEEIKNVQLIIAGNGDIKDDLIELTKNRELNNKVKFLGRVPLEDLHGYTMQAKLGFSLEQAQGLNYRFALPNKIFDYIQAGVPIIVSGMPEMQRIVEKYHTGEVFLGETASELALRINNILSNPSKLENYHQNCITAADELCWEKEAKVLLDIFAGLT